MAAVTNSDVSSIPTQIEIVDRLTARSAKVTTTHGLSDQVTLLQHDSTFASLIGEAPSHALLFSTAGTTNNPFFHEACVLLPDHDELYITSNLLQATSSANFPTILISRIKLYRNEDGSIKSAEWAKMRPPPGIDMPNGGVNYEDGILFCAQGNTSAGSGGIYYMPRSSPPKPLVTNFHGREFNSVNDVVVAKDGSIWFTDPCYGWEQDFRPKPKLPCQVYRFDPVTGDLRVVADGFGRPNGIAFSVDESIVYVTDTDQIHGDGTRDLMRPATIYAFDVHTSSGAPFLINRRIFAHAADGFPDGIKCDVYGNVYSGCGDGVEVWNSAGTLIGTILVPGGVANFCFGKDGEIFLCAEQKLWRLQLARTTRGALLGI
ncbi:hypothetical protein MFRU_058g00220 [Monilinia fructicola]|uniref:SMP-30/Gluconolactonase/LRE-like region domain-containing protein n=1 Tax=Monilinia fructicola TaxID=38448 RepID=A0A5M9JSW4_MONFR|nr:hypothetical protein EYC84_000504 [Monilinia fructicola]KAG4025439.1 hypothetical protein MFRU_058g00220 [Monilinia fructicola]